MDVRRSYAPPSIIKSIQRGVISMTSAQANLSQTVASVNTAKSVLNFLGILSAETGANYFNTHLTLINSTTIQANRNSSNTFNVQVSWELVEYY